MNVLCFLVLCSFLSALLLTPLVRDLAWKLGLVDQPDNTRKLHRAPVPRVGGIAICISYVLSLSVLLVFAHRDGQVVTGNMNLVWRFLPAACAVFATGLIDDLIGLKPWQKLAGQFAGAAWAYWAGVRILGVGDHAEHWWSIPLTLLWLAGCTNAFNLIDGLDGLAAGIGFLATLTIVLEALIQGNFALAVSTVPLAGALLGFLRYNLNPASIFLGDCGSLLIGFLLGCLGVIWSQKSVTLLGMTAPLMAMTVPVLEIVLSIVRRYMRQQPIFSADTGHVHHRLLALGLRPSHVALTLYAVGGIGAACSLLLGLRSIRFGGAAIVLFCIVVGVGIRRLRYVEFGVAHRMLATGEFRRMLKANIRLQMFHDAVAHSKSEEDSWPIIMEACRDLGFVSVQLQVGDTAFEETFQTAGTHRKSEDDWTVRIELAHGDYAIIRHPLNAPMQSMMILPFLETLHGLLLAKVKARADTKQDGACSCPRIVRGHRRVTFEEAVGGGQVMQRVIDVAVQRRRFFKRPVFLVLCVLCFSVLSFAVYRSREPRPILEYDALGLSSLKLRGAELLSFGDVRVGRVLMRDPSGRRYAPPLDSTVQVDSVAGKVVRQFSWGDVAAQFTAAPGRVDIALTIVNRSADTLQEASYEPVGLKFPAKITNYDGAVPLMGHNVGDATLIGMNWGSGLMVLVNDDVVSPLIAGFPWALDKPANTTFPLRICTGRDPMLPDMLPYIDRPIAPGASETYRLSLRFGPRDSSPTQLGSDVLRRFAARFPSHLQWQDRRPIGTVFLATAGLNSAKNPRGWLLDRDLNVSTAEGKVEFRRKILQLADSSIRILRSMNAQGAITWDIEGQEYPKASYAGDPRQYSALAPEMAPVADEYFARIRRAGFRIGVCVRPQELVFDPQHHTAYERETSDPAGLLKEKIAWAKNRWGATLFYVDANGDPNRPLDAGVLEKVAAAFPDVLLIPEHKNVRYFAFSAPYFSLREGLASTPAAIRAVYPGAFSIVNTADGRIAERRDELASAVKLGDILLFRTWYDDPANLEVKSLF
jgi:UDP-GlcNAc:undecaprenyl-phosphate GlcNAc-1-phosphate transferase